MLYCEASASVRPALFALKKKVLRPVLKYISIHMLYHLECIHTIF